VEVADAGGHPRPARSARPLTLAPSYAVLCAAQALTVLAARPPRRTFTSNRLLLAGIVVPAALLGAGVAIVRAVAGGPHALALAGAVGAPLLAAAGPRRLPLAAALWLVAWLAHGLVAQGAGVALIALAAMTIAQLVARFAPDWSIAGGLVAVAIVDVVLVWGTRQVQPATTALHAATLPELAGRPIPPLQDATFGSAMMGWLDLVAPALLGVVARRRLAAAAATGLAAGAWGLLLFVTSTVPATVPALAGLACARAGRGHVGHPRQPRGAGGGSDGGRGDTS
jgi:hypothetical protein